MSYARPVLAVLRPRVTGAQSVAAPALPHEREVIPTVQELISTAYFRIFRD